MISKRRKSLKDINSIYILPMIWYKLILPLQKLISSIKPDFIADIESRGFFSRSALAFQEKVGFIPISKANKLPGKVLIANYKFEYGEDRLEIPMNSFEKDSKIIVINYLFATVRTANAAGKLIRKARSEFIGYSFLLKLVN